MKKSLIICGPTATGKTKLALQLAKRFDGEIVSADSRQVYRGMDIGTGKDIGNVKCQMSNVKSISKDKFQIGFYVVDGVRVWLLDIVNPDYRFNVADYRECADIVIKDIQERKKLPMIVGGTGFYIKAVTDGIETIGVEPDWKLRVELQRYKVSELQRILEDYNPERSRGMNESDGQNPRRLIRAIEVARWKCEVRNGKLDKEVGSRISENQKIPFQNPASHFKSPTSTLFIGLTASNEILYQRIDQRVENRVEAGIENEIRGLLKKGYTWENSALGTTLAYREWEEYFDKVPRVSNVSRVSRGEDSDTIREQVIQKWKFDEHNYARRQMTWFRKNKNINWFDVAEGDLYGKVEKLVKSWYS